jgi:hypothetical protein
MKKAPIKRLWLGKSLPIDVKKPLSELLVRLFIKVGSGVL